jgi:hypothetical protein
MRAGDTVVVIGVGGIGTGAIQGARIGGAAQIIAVDPVDFKQKSALQFGATHSAATAVEALAMVRELTYGVMADAVVVSPSLITADDVRDVYDGPFRRLLPNHWEAQRQYYRDTGIFPIMHILGVRRELADEHPWLPIAASKAFEEAKSIALARLADTSATKVTLPFVEEQLRAARALMGPDFWSYGVAPNRHVLDNFLQHHHAQGLSKRRLEVEELFHPSTLETHKI